jgi:hypothetical protein
MVDRPSETEPDAEQPRSPGERAHGWGLIAAAVVVFGSPILIPLWKHFNPSAVEVAEQHLDFLEKNGGSEDDICAAHRGVQSAYEAAEDSRGYQLAKLEADAYCLNLEAKRRLEGY